MVSHNPTRTILRGRIVLEDRIMDDGMVVFENKTIQYVGPPLAELKSEAETVPSGGYVWPGLIDVHVHGAGGSDVMDATPEAIRTIADTLIKYGVTGFLATTVTGEKKHLARVLANVSEHGKRIKDGAAVLGIHLEGPWICPERAGAQNSAFITDPTPEDVDWAIQQSNGHLKIVTMAPERPRGLEVIRRFSKRGIRVSLGHSSATFDEVLAAIEVGACHVTHCFNAMRGLHHREPGMVGAALTDDRLTVELIVDGHHVHPAGVKLICQAKGVERVMLISDGIRAVGMPSGEYDLGGLKVVTDGETARLADGTLAGSLLTLDAAIRNTVKFGATTLPEAVKMASLVPARRIGMDKSIGSIREGKLANLVVVDEACRVQRVWREGRLVHVVR